MLTGAHLVNLKVVHMTIVLLVELIEIVNMLSIVLVSSLLATILVYALILCAIMIQRRGILRFRYLTPGWPPRYRHQRFSHWPTPGFQILTSAGYRSDRYSLIGPYHFLLLLSHIYCGLLFRLIHFLLL